jgi:putative hydrolase of the HAD superfamily
MSKKAIIFDFGGVLIDLDIEGCKAAFKRDLGYEKIDDILDPCHQKGIVGDMEEGVISGDEFCAEVLKESRPGARAEDVKAAFMHILAGIPAYKGPLLNRLAESYDIYILSNNNPIVASNMSMLFAGVGVDYQTLFKKSFLSYEMKALKPSEEFYKRVIEQIDHPVEDLIFIDDSQKNVDGALAVGLPSVYYDPTSDLAALLAEVLGDPSLAEYGPKYMEEK